MQETARFNNCFVDDDPQRLERTYADVTFRLRSITIGEHAEIMQKSRVAPVTRHSASDEDLTRYAKLLKKDVADLTDDEQVEARTLAEAQANEATIDVWRMQVLTVAAALGVWRQFGDEGWSANKPVTVETVAHLKPRVLTALYTDHKDFFRPFADDAFAVGAGDPLGVQATDAELVPSTQSENG